MFYFCCELEFEQFDSNSVITSIEEHETTPKACNHQTKSAVKEDEDNNNSGDDDNDDICPLFMDGLPKNFASNPQLAAIASLLNDEDDDDDNDYSQVEEEEEEEEEEQKLNKNNECSTKKNLSLDYKNDGSDSTPLTVANNTTSSVYERWTTGDRSRRCNYTALSSSQNRRRRQQRTSPYPQKLLSKKSNSNAMSSSNKRLKTKGASVGETTLFLKMWQL